MRVLLRRVDAEERARLVGDGQHARHLERALAALRLDEKDNRLCTTAELLDDLAIHHVFAEAPHRDGIADGMLGRRARLGDEAACR